LRKVQFEVTWEAVKGSQGVTCSKFHGIRLAKDMIGTQNLKSGLNDSNNAHPKAKKFDTAYMYIRFDDSSFSPSKVTIAAFKI